LVEEEEHLSGHCHGLPHSLEYKRGGPSEHLVSEVVEYIVVKLAKHPDLGEREVDTTAARWHHEKHTQVHERVILHHPVQVLLQAAVRRGAVDGPHLAEGVGHGPLQVAKHRPHRCKGVSERRAWQAPFMKVTKNTPKMQKNFSTSTVMPVT
jgi:hypothetical protein